MNDTTVSMTFKNNVTGLSKLERYEARLKSLQNIMAKMPGNIILDSGSNISNILKSAEKVLNDYNKNIVSVKNNTNLLNSTTKNMGNTISTAFDVTKIVTFAKTIEKVVTGISKFTKYSSDYIENLNLMDVAFQGATEEGREFVNTLTEMYGLDESALTKTVGLFKQLSNAMGLSDEIGTSLTKTMTLMANDISSLYNTSFERATSVLESALAGQTKPIRSLTGADITQTTLQVTLDSYGINETVSQLSYLEKRLLIVTSLINQLDEAQNDYGRTIESVANQSRIFEQQISRLSRAIGNVFMPILSKVLPYLNGILMAMTEIINYIAGLLGFKEEDFDYFGATSDSVSELTDNLNAAGASAKKLKQGLRGFDKLNVITTPSASSVGTGGINPSLINAANKAMKNYQETIEKVRMKANDVRDSILEWLGFTVETDDETGELKIKFDHITGGTVLGALAVGGTIFSGVSKILKIFDAIGLLKFKNISKLVESFNIIKGIGAGLTFVGINDLIKSLNTLKDNTLVDNIANISSSIGEIATGLALFVGITTPLGIVLGIIGQVVTILGNLPKHFENIKKYIDDPSWQNLSELMQSSIGGMGIIGTLINKIVEDFFGGYDKIAQKLTEFKNIIEENIINPIKEKLTSILDWININIIQPIVGFFKPIIEAIGEVFIYAYSKAKEIVGGIITNISLILSKVWEIISTIGQIFVALGKAAYTYVIKPIFDFIGQIATTVYENAIKPIMNFFGDVGGWVYKHIMKPIWDKIVWIKDKVVGIFKTVGISVVDFISGTFKGVVNGIFSTIERNINRFIKMLNKAVKTINKIPGVDIKEVSELKLPRLKTGLDFVPKDYFPAFLDYGERVLTKEENREYTKNLYTANTTTQKQSINLTLPIQLGSTKIAEVVLNDLQDMASANGKPITIG